MQLFVGLGNPGTKYANNRHNVGFMALDRIAEDHCGSAWKSAHQGMISECRFGSEKILLLKPMTFMNLSGQSVGEAMRYYKLTPSDVMVLHDEIDLAPGKLRLKEGGGHAGHNGLRSIHQHIGPDYRRMRIGVGHPGHKDRVPIYVLQDFAKADYDWLEPMITGIASGFDALVQGQQSQFQNAVASARNAPASPPRPTKKEPAKPEPDRDARTPMQKLLDKFR